MADVLEKIIERQECYYSNDAAKWLSGKFAEARPEVQELLNLKLPKYERYVVCNLRGGIGKTTLTFNLAYDTDDLLVVDSCPQGNLSAFFDQNYHQRPVTLYDALLPYFIPGMGRANGISSNIGATNQFFAKKKAFFVPSSSNLYEFPSTMEGALAQARTLPPQQMATAVTTILTSLKDLVDRELQTTETRRVLIDTSPFFSGATHLSWHTQGALIVPVRTDQQSVDSLQLMIETLSSPSKPFQRAKANLGLPDPKIQLVLVTHCGWSTAAGSRNQPNNQTKVYLNKVRDIVARHIHHFTTNDPDNHIVPIDDFLGSGRISSAKSTPLKELQPGQSFTISNQRVEVNESVEKCKKQISFITANIW